MKLLISIVLVAVRYIWQDIYRHGQKRFVL